MKTSRMLAFCLVMFAVVRLHATVLTGPVTNINNGHAYYLLSSTNWDAAEAEAVALGGHLVTINDALENAWVHGTFGGFDGVARHMWIGLTDREVEGQWKWVTRERSSYRNWAPGEPNNGGGYYTNEDHVLMRYPLDTYAGQWNDAPEFQMHEAVVEVGPPVTELSIRYSEVEICYNTATNLTYQLQYCTNATFGAWWNLGSPVAGTGLPVCAKDSVSSTDPQRSYRVLTSQ
jgi:hypothetical protein